jgi:hypothetical protein
MKDLIRKYFAYLYNVDTNGFIRLINIDHLGEAYIFKTQYNFVICITYDYRDNCYELFIDFDITKYDRQDIFHMKNLSDVHQFQKSLSKALHSKFGWFYRFRKNQDEIAEAHIEFFAQYVKENLNNFKDKN